MKISVIIMIILIPCYLCGFNGLSQNSCALQSEVNGLFNNPAGLCSIQNRVIGLMYDNAGVLNDFNLVYAQRLYQFHLSAGIGYRVSDYFDLFDMDGNRTDRFNYDSFSGSLGAAASLSFINIPDLNAGTRLKFIRETVLEYSDQAYLADIGFLYEYLLSMAYIDKLNLYTVIGDLGKNLGDLDRSSIKAGLLAYIPIQMDTDSLLLGIGFKQYFQQQNKKNNGFIFSLAYQKDLSVLSSQWAGNIMLGLSYYYSKANQISGDASGLTYGGSINTRSVGLGYSYALNGITGPDHLINLSVKF